MASAEPVASPASLAEERLVAICASVMSEMERAVGIAAEIGPEWENVVDDIRAPFQDLLEALRARLNSRLLLASQMPDASARELISNTGEQR